MDPVTALAGATAAFQQLKKVFVNKFIFGHDYSLIALLLLYRFYSLKMYE